MDYIVEDPTFRRRTEDPAFASSGAASKDRRRNNIAEKLKNGTWLVLLYHYNCPDCGRAIPMYEQMARDLEGNEDFLRIALVAVPPYGQYIGHRGPVSEDSPCILGRLPETKEWFVTTPAVALLTYGRVKAAWEEKAPNLDIILQKMAKANKVDKKQRFFTLKTDFARLSIERR